MKKTKLAIIFTSLILVMSIAGSLLFLNNVTGTIRLFKTAITVNFKDNVYTYNDKEIESINYTISDGNLFNGDRLNFKFNKTIKNAGTYTRDSFTYSIVSTSGQDVTSSYIINENFENIVVNKRELGIKTASAYGTLEDFSSGNVLFHGYYIQTGSLCSGHTIQADGFRNSFHVGNFDNTCNITIKDSNYKIVTNNYDITIYTGTLFVISNNSSTDKGDQKDDSKSDSDDKEDNYEYKDRGDDKDGSGDSASKSNDKLDLDKDDEPDNGPQYTTKEEVYEDLFKHMFFYYKKTKGSQFIRFHSDLGGTYSTRKFLKPTAYKNKYGLNPDEFTSYILKDEVKHALGTMDYSEFESRNYDVHLNYPVYNKEQDNDLFPVLSDLKSDSLDLEGLYYDYMSNPSLLDNAKITDSTFIKAEKEYYEFAKQNYLGVDSTTLTFLKQFIKDNNLNGNSIYEISNKIIALFKKEYYYKMWELECHKADNWMISFLRDTKTGSCTEFSAGAILIFRALGYPARQIGGYVANGLGKIDIVGLNGHAKAQVYYAGRGWVDLEFTVGTVTEGTPSLPFQGDGDDSADEETADITITTESLSKTYDGTPLTSSSFTIEGDDKLKKGHKIYAYCNNSITNAGSIENSVNYFILDSNFNDVSDEYNVITNFGILNINKKELEIRTNDVKVSFNEQLNNRGGISYYSKSLVDGDRIAKWEAIKFKSKGTYSNIIIVTKIVNKNGDDVTSNYEITYQYGTLEVV